MKKRLALVLCSVMAIMSLSGCGAGATDSTTAKEETDTKNKDVLTIEFFQQKGEEGPQKGYQAIIDKFNKENPDIKIEMNTVPDAPTVLTSRISSGDIPVIFTDFPTQLQFKQKVKNGFVEKLTGQEFLNQVEPESLKMGKAEDGGDYALPYSHNYMGVYYNQEIFEKYSLE
ncbi:ABC transporter substrate-binding protein, partial [Robinsoniella peoriensis]|uniref:ABC transporter substrate-binding protein n=1 Tax=Robinsoniella peoriensis TaxID=180332 RepID=UPI00374FF164